MGSVYSVGSVAVPRPDSASFAQKRQNASVNPTFRKIACAASGDRPRHSGESRPSYHSWANCQHWSIPTTAPRVMERLSHQASTSTSDRK